MATAFLCVVTLCDLLYNLSKDEYIRILLYIFESNEDSVAGYRARACDNPPLGLLKERRKSVKGSIVQKNAHDCFILNQFVSGNMSDINHLFKTQQSHNAETAVCSQHSEMYANETTLIKNSVSEMQTENTYLKQK